MIAGLGIFGTSAFAWLSIVCTLLSVTLYATVAVVSDFVRDRRVSTALPVPPANAEPVIRADSRQRASRARTFPHD